MCIYYAYIDFCLKTLFHCSCSIIKIIIIKESAICNVIWFHRLNSTCYNSFFLHFYSFHVIENIIRILITAEGTVQMSNAEGWMLIEMKSNSIFIPQH